MTRSRTLLLTLALAACGEPVTAVHQNYGAAAHDRASLSAPEAIPGAYIVLFAGSTADPAKQAADIARRFGGQTRHVYQYGVRGAAFQHLPDSAVSALRKNPAIAEIFPDTRVALTASQSLYGPAGFWALDFLDDNAPFSRDYSFTYFQQGAGVHIYILDTGINGNHSEFFGRLGDGVSTIDPALGGPYVDGQGHGTSMASLAAGSTFGVAKQATLHSVRVAGGVGVVDSDIMAGYDWVFGHAIRPAIINQSTETSTGARQMQAIAVGSGILVVAAAGNANVDACSSLPPAPDAVSVGAAAHDPVNNDRLVRWAGGNFGNCIDIFGPGDDNGIISASHTGSTVNDTRLTGGTSAATAFVSGVAATILGEIPSATPDRLAQVLTGSATRGGVASLIDSPNLFANSLHRYLEVSGQTVFQSTTAQYATWSVGTALGGDGSWTYVWQEEQNGNWVTVGTGSSYSRWIYPVSSAETVNLRLVGTSVGKPFAVQFLVWVYPNCGVELC